MKPHRPNFFIVGAPKSGTTAIAEYLRQHPQVFICRPKEPHFFSTDMPRKAWVRSLDAYQELFRGACASAIRIGEASVWYLHSVTAAEQIAAFDPEARIIIMLRNPVEMVPAVHAQHLASFQEDIPDFRTAWSLSESRARGQYIPRMCLASQTLDYKRVAAYGTQVGRYLRCFDRSQLLVINYDTFKLEPRSTWLEIQSFLGLTDDNRHDFPIINARYRVSRPAIARMVAAVPRSVHHAAARAKRVLKVDSFGVLPLMARLTRVPSERATLEEDLRLEINDCYRDEIALLAELNIVDISSWLAGAPA